MSQINNSLEQSKQWKQKANYKPFALCMPKCQNFLHNWYLHSNYKTLNFYLYIVVKINFLIYLWGNYNCLKVNKLFLNFKYENFQWKKKKKVNFYIFAFSVGHFVCSILNLFDILSIHYLVFWHWPITQIYNNWN